MKNKYYITTPIYYVNDTPHIGSAYTTVAADVLARWHRQVGDKTFFLTGTDEHGAKVASRAEEAGKKPQAFVDEVAQEFQNAWQSLNISHDRFIRTTESEHIKAVQVALQKMFEQEDIYAGQYEGLYCKGCEQYKSERDLINGKCAEHGTVPEKMSEKCYMFRLLKFQDRLLAKIKSDELKINPPERKNEVISFYEKEGLFDIAFSRKNVTWGIPLPWDGSQTAYVWADAFLNYLTGLGWTGPETEVPEKWPPDVQLMSKDILRVHATIWPAMLLSLGLPLPKELFVHGYFLVNGKKMSKSLSNVIRPEDMINRYGVDATRYLLLTATPFGNDGDVSWVKFDEKYNADLANGLGNLVARSITLAEKMQNVNIKMQNDNAKIDNWGGYAFSHNNINQVWVAYKECLNKIQIDKILSLILGVGSESRDGLKTGPGMVRFLDNYITLSKPWELIKNNNDIAGIVIYNILERLRHVALMLLPFMPTTAEKIRESLGLNPAQELKKDYSESVKWGGLPVDTKVKKIESLFPRI